ncbi:MAG: hypothetical protein HXS44_14565 [Theionarchaea archaeon]|nr:hypothetical protein [Theionarchaea archaeon]
MKCVIEKTTPEVTEFFAGETERILKEKYSHLLEIKSRDKSSWSLN